MHGHDAPRVTGGELKSQASMARCYNIQVICLCVCCTVSGKLVLSSRLANAVPKDCLRCLVHILFMMLTGPT